MWDPTRAPVCPQHRASWGFRIRYLSTCEATSCLSVCQPGTWHAPCVVYLLAQLLERGPRKDPPWSHQVPRVSRVTAWLCYWPFCVSSRNRPAWGIIMLRGLHQQFPLGGLVQEFFRKGQFPDESLPDCPTHRHLRPGFKTK